MNKAHTPMLFIRSLCLLLFTLFSVSCATRSKPQADWNSLKIWQQVASNPPTYIPTGYGASQPRNDRDGTWFTDKRDGKRVFVPKHAVRGIERGGIEGEAKKVTGNEDKPRLTPGQKACWGILAFFAALGDAKIPPPD